MKDKGKGKAKPSDAVDSTTNQPEETIGIDKEDEFSIQLNWCLTNLKSILRGESDSCKKMNDRKVAEAGRVYNSLSDPKTPFIRKRQLMANYFGDYRKQMAKEEEKFRCKSNQLKITNCLSESKIGSKPIICKKREKLKESVPSEPFKFNFPQ